MRFLFTFFILFTSITFAKEFDRNEVLVEPHLKLKDKEVSILDNAFEKHQYKRTKYLKSINVYIYTKLNKKSKDLNPCLTMKLKFIKHCERNKKLKPNFENSDEMMCKLEKPQEDSITTLNNEINKIVNTGNQCNIIKDIESFETLNGELSDFWAQSYVGADLVHQEIKSENYPIPDNLIGILDISLDKHDEHVKILFQMNWK